MESYTLIDFLADFRALLISCCICAHSVMIFDLACRSAEKEYNIEETTDLAQLTKKLKQENARLKTSLLTQVGQRVYFQEEYNKSQVRCVTQIDEKQSLKNELERLTKEVKELKSLIGSHEVTNEALQRQLSDAFANTNDLDQANTLRKSLSGVIEELEMERVNHRATKAALTDVCEEKARMAGQYETTINDLQTRLTEFRDGMDDEVTLLRERLHIANQLKDQYKKALSKQRSS